MKTKRMPQIEARYQSDVTFRRNVHALAKVIYGMTEQESRDTLNMAEELNAHTQFEAGNSSSLVRHISVQRRECYANGGILRIAK